MIVTNAGSANSAGRITQNHRTIVAIGKHIVAEQALTRSCKGVGVEESADFGVVITAL
jgi:hypothetical protein